MIRLEDIDSPAKLRQLSVAQLNELAGLLRRRIITTVARTGGHLASNLGVVELTIALLYCFDGIEDRVVWDVGHQSYAWKILTGRNDRFDTLRQEGGLAGFPKREESPYDAFNTGHSSTSISAALGISRGLRLQGKAGR
ncbi:MAG: 1-deoxy-D-xylulose-5-phosphate synthase N-terminal domain-containing protein, partial [Oscillospiraceae bacterium]|nr:1-deoxy-D-xylulose-5-phosphate synthase N-terminal domain-containing protein [Oscillospiraceae bacterium]